MPSKKAQKCSTDADDMESLFEIKRSEDGGGKGFGMYSKRAVEEGFILCRDRPLLHSQSGKKKVFQSRHQFVCANCGRFLGSVEIQLGLLTGEMDICYLLASFDKDNTDNKQDQEQKKNKRHAFQRFVHLAETNGLKLPTYPKAELVWLCKNKEDEEAMEISDVIAQIKHGFLDEEDFPFVFCCSDTNCADYAKQRLCRSKEKHATQQHQQSQAAAAAASSSSSAVDFQPLEHEPDNTIFLMVAQLCAVTASFLRHRLKEEGGSGNVDEWAEKFLKPVLTLVRRPYKECLDGVDDPNDLEEFEGELEKAMVSSLDWIKRRYRDDLMAFPIIEKLLLTREQYDLLCGSLCLNTKEVVIPNPLVFMLLGIDGMEEEEAKQQLINFMIPFLERIAFNENARKQHDDDNDDDDDDSDDDDDDNDEVIEFNWNLGEEGGSVYRFSSSLFKPYRCDALFPTVSRINHSCDPNCECIFLEDNTAVIAATRDISEGEELCISYIDHSQSLEDRRRDLMSYGFACQCKRCIQESVPASKQKKQRK